MNRTFSCLVLLSPNPAPGGAIADITGNFVGLWSWQFLKPDGTLIGTLESKGILTDSTAVTILGGTGAFLGARGTHLVGTTSAPTRSASIAEDPSNRRNRAGGKAQGVVCLIPMERPQIVTTSGEPAVFHADFTPVTAAKPAKTGEVLIVQATGLGPTIPSVNPGQPFPSDALPQVNSPLSVSMNGKPADVINGIGWPGLVDTYRVDFRVPDGTAPGTATIQLTAAWIAGPSVNIPTQ